MKDVVDAHQREFEPNQDFENVQLEETLRKILLMMNSRKRRQPLRKKLQISLENRAKYMVEVKLDCRRKSSYAPALTL